MGQDGGVSGFDDERTCHAAALLQRAAAVDVWVVPEGAWAVVLWDLVLVCCGSVRADETEDVVRGTHGYVWIPGMALGVPPMSTVLLNRQIV